MTGWLSSAVDSLLSSLAQAAGQTITYRRGSDSGSIEGVVPGQSEHEEYGPDGVSITSRSRDWIIPVADLVLDTAGVVVPAAGDVIEEADGTQHRVLPNEAERCYDMVSQYERAYRIFTEKVT